MSEKNEKNKRTVEEEIQDTLKDVRALRRGTLPAALFAGTIGIAFHVAIFWSMHDKGVPLRFSLIVGLGTYGISALGFNSYAKQVDREYDLLAAKMIWHLSLGDKGVQNQIVKCVLGCKQFDDQKVSTSEGSMGNDATK
jgi:hypothetical protein